jgi:hypothetical protein
MKSLVTVLTTVGVVMAAWGALASQAATRMTDKQVEDLMEGIEKDVERFTKAVDSQYRTAVIRSASGEVAVEPFLKDLKDDSKKMRDRFDSKYSASTEVLAFLRQAHAIEARSEAGGGLFGAESEWPRLRGSVDRLSQEYGVNPATDPAGWHARRINDDELKGALKSLSDATKPFKKELDNVSKKLDSVTKSQRDDILQSVDRLDKTAKDLRDGVGKGADASGDLALLSSTANELQAFVASKGLPGPVSGAWGSVEKELSLVKSAFGIPES